MERFKRTVQLIGEENFEKLKNANILVVGVGGVGGFVCEALVRSGVENITIIDFDKVDTTNINRQIIALTSTVGKYKVDVLKKRLQDINPNAKVNAIKEQIVSDNVANFVNNKYTYVIDAIDQVQNKIELICACKKLDLSIISAMGAGNRVGIPQYVVSDIYKTHDDGLAKKVRKLLREKGIDKLDVVYSPNCDQTISKDIGSISYHPSVCGLTIASYVINQIIKGEGYGSYNNKSI